MEPTDDPARPVGRRAVLVAAATALAGCAGGGDGTPTETATRTPTPTATATPSPTPSPEPPVRLGLVTPTSGNMAVLGQVQTEAAGMALVDVNADGGVLGRPLELAVVNSGDDRGSGQAALSGLAAEGVPAAVAVGRGNLRLWGEVAADEGVVLLLSGPLSPSTAAASVRDGVRHAAATGPDDRQRPLAVGHALDDVVGAGTAAVLRPTWGSADDPAERVRAAFDGDLTTVEYEPFADGRDYDGVLERVADADPDAVGFLGATPQATLPLFEQAADAGTEVPWVTDGTTADRLADRLPSEGFPVYAVAPSPAETRGTREFRSAYAGRLVRLAARTYDAVVLFALAARRAGATGPEAVSEALSGVSRPPGEPVTGTDLGSGSVPDGRVDYVGASGHVDLGSALASVVPVDVVSLRGDRGTVDTLAPERFGSLRN
jgi:ABC-type branched-subunit amino acid transport system substrate-binding protein